MALIKSWIPIVDESGSFKEISGWDVVLKHIYTVLMTTPGSRSWQPEFGCRLNELLFEPSGTVTTENLRNEVEYAMRWVPYVSVISVNVSIVPITSRGAGVAAQINMVVKYNNETLPIGISVPSNLDKLNGTIYDVGIQ